MTRAGAVAACTLALLATSIADTSPLPAQTGRGSGPVWSGYVRSLSAIQALGYTPPGADRRSAFNAEVVRLRWQLAFGEHVGVDVHDRLQLQMSTTPEAFGSGVTGFGVSAVPGRTVDLETTFVDEPGFRVWHDLDRLALRVRADAVDLTLGRQAITWGISTLFPIADLWAQFSPFELDTEEKRGVDAVRALLYPRPGLELDAVVADRGSVDDLSGGMRATVELPTADVYVAAGKFWRELIALAGVSWVLDTWKIRAEVATPYALDRGGWRDLRATVGADRLGSTWIASVELHRNGLGTSETARYVEHLTAPEFARGETYLLGRTYLGGTVSWQSGDRVTLAAAGRANLDDASVSITPFASYDLGQSARLSLGALLTRGRSPRFADSAPPLLRSEFGTYGQLVYTAVALYY
ncbi:MAG: hypothetical protein KC645_11335 [Gemmatimonadetes bacterium]|nr:hypothetical protein [Gemmatimonadota bacterium]